MMNETNMMPADIPPLDHCAAEDAQASGNRGVDMNQLLPFEEVPPPAEMNFDASVEAIAVA
jgi:hypothetical protein